MNRIKDGWIIITWNQKMAEIVDCHRRICKKYPDIAKFNPQYDEPRSIKFRYNCVTKTYSEPWLKY